MRKAWPAVVLCLTLGSAWPREGEKVDDFALEDTQGRSHTLYEHKDAKAVVLVFLGVECPMANRYTVRLIEAHRSYGTKGVVFFGVNSNALEGVDAIARHANESKYPFPLLLDRGQELLRPCRGCTADNRGEAQGPTETGIPCAGHGLTLLCQAGNRVGGFFPL